MWTRTDRGTFPATPASLAVIVPPLGGQTLRRHELSRLTDDPSAQRVPLVIAPKAKPRTRQELGAAASQGLEKMVELTQAVEPTRPAGDVIAAVCVEHEDAYALHAAHVLGSNVDREQLTADLQRAITREMDLARGRGLSALEACREPALLDLHSQYAAAVRGLKRF